MTCLGTNHVTLCGPMQYGFRWAKSFFPFLTKSHISHIPHIVHLMHKCMNAEKQIKNLKFHDIDKSTLVFCFQ